MEFDTDEIKRAELLKEFCDTKNYYIFGDDSPDLHDLTAPIGLGYLVQGSYKHQCFCRLTEGICPGFPVMCPNDPEMKEPSGGS